MVRQSGQQQFFADHLAKDLGGLANQDIGRRRSNLGLQRRVIVECGQQHRHVAFGRWLLQFGVQGLDEGLAIQESGEQIL